MRYCTTAGRTQHDTELRRPCELLATRTSWIRDGRCCAGGPLGHSEQHLSWPPLKSTAAFVLRRHVQMGQDVRGGFRGREPNPADLERGAVAARACVSTSKVVPFSCAVDSRSMRRRISTKLWMPVKTCANSAALGCRNRGMDGAGMGNQVSGQVPVELHPEIGRLHENRFPKPSGAWPGQPTMPVQSISSASQKGSQQFMLLSLDHCF